MTWHNPKTKLPAEFATVLLAHWYDDSPDTEPLCETGYLADGKLWWHNPVHNTDWLEPHAWSELPMLPSGRPR